MKLSNLLFTEQVGKPFKKATIIQIFDSHIILSLTTGTEDTYKL